MNLQDQSLKIETPENVAFGYDIAGIGSRFLAALVDTLLIIVLQGIVNLTLFLLISTVIQEAVSGENDLLGWVIALFGLVAFAFFWGYYIFFEMIWNGQSPGKRWVGLRVIRTDGAPITLIESIIRNLVRLVDFLPVYYGLGVITMFIDDQSRRLGDLAAGTLVVRDRVAITLESLAGETALPRPKKNMSTVTANLPLDRLSDRDLQPVEEFLRRRTELSNRSALAQQFVQHLFDRMNLTPPQLGWWEVEDLLAEIVQLHHNRHTR